MKVVYYIRGATLLLIVIAFARPREHFSDLDLDIVPVLPLTITSGFPPVR